MNAEMTDERQAWLEQRARTMGYQKGRVFFSTCPVCGSAKWGSTTTAERDGTPIEDLHVSEYVDSGPYNCFACMSVQQRSPEVFQWVLGVVDWSHTKPKGT